MPLAVANDALQLLALREELTKRYTDFYQAQSIIRCVMGQHVFWIVKCPKCGHPNALRYIGEDDGRTPQIKPTDFPEFVLPCLQCNWTHRYSPHDLERRQMDYPPGPEWRDAV